MNLQRKNKYNQLIKFIIIIVFCECLLGCSQYLIKRPGRDFLEPSNIEQYKNTNIVIDNTYLKDQRYSSKYLSSIENIFSNSFANVSICTSCSKNKNDTIYIIPNHFDLYNSNNQVMKKQFFLEPASLKSIKGSAKILYNNNDIDIFYCSGTYKFLGRDYPVLEAFLFPLIFIDSSALFLFAHFNNNNAILNALFKDISIDLYDKTVLSEKFLTFAETIKQRKTKPSKIEIRTKYTDNESIPNKSIDAGETSLLTIYIDNTGKGTAFDVKLNINSSEKNILFNNTTMVGNVQPNETKIIKIPINANLNLKNGIAQLIIKVHEKRGYDAQPVKLQIPTVALNKPLLSIDSTLLNDQTGLGTGDGDGKPENNETVEIQAFIKNNGVGNAYKVSVKLKDVTDGIEIIKNYDEIGLIELNSGNMARLALKIPRTFSKSAIKYTLVAKDIRGMETQKIIFYSF